VRHTSVLWTHPIDADSYVIACWSIVQHSNHGQSRYPHFRTQPEVVARRCYAGAQLTSSSTQQVDSRSPWRRLFFGTWCCCFSDAKLSHVILGYYLSVLLTMRCSLLPFVLDCGVPFVHWQWILVTFRFREILSFDALGLYQGKINQPHDAFSNDW
jgi:hypothetical protein